MSTSASISLGQSITVRAWYCGGPNHVCQEGRPWSGLQKKDREAGLGSVAPRSRGSGLLSPSLLLSHQLHPPGLKFIIDHQNKIPEDALVLAWPGQLDGWRGEDKRKVALVGLLGSDHVF